MDKRKKKTKAPDKPKLGRPLTPIDWGKVDAMSAIHCTGPEIATVLGVSEDTLARATRRERKMTFADYIRQKRGTGKASLRRLQWKAAQTGDKTMLVWLGKNWLDQTDKMQQDSKITEETTVIYLPDNGRK